MTSIWQRRLSNLLSVKSIITIVLSVAFAHLAFIGRVTDQDFLTIFSMVIAFYSGTQSQRNQTAEETDQKR